MEKRLIGSGVVSGVDRASVYWMGLEIAKGKGQFWRLIGDFVA